MQALLRLTAALMSTVEGVRFAYTSLTDWCRKYSLFEVEGHPFGSNARISGIAWNRAWAVGVSLLRPDLLSLLTASGDSLGESGEEGL